ncbi:lytic polysaccharide monooxygenase [Glonium stellatum]|uniref:lytic cellulose monooxygenase (C4-dehydrogenating) n=1 Tax=Glonium stellatum TaxID=574774 RepID=A0A8E2JTT3_9PEZI|nr:lytic polysaccharide monooxygenase [Glonium stellatum]
MKSSLYIVFSAISAASAHYTFPALIANGATTSQWQYVRMTANHYSNGPVTDVTSSAIRCYQDPSNPTTQTMTVAAGSTVGFTAVSSITHPGPLQFYMAKVPEGQTAATWDGSGDVWFKIYAQGPTISSSGMTWASQGKTSVDVTIPKSLPSGDYLLRIEHIGLHSASAAGGAQFYISCAQLTVTGGGTGSPSPLVAFPGAYKATDPGLMINIYYPVPTSYTLPGPAVWTG